MYKRVGGTVIAYKNYTDYAGINDNGAGIVEKSLDCWEQEDIILNNP